jgi:hypothetical protein
MDPSNQPSISSLAEPHWAGLARAPSLDWLKAIRVYVVVVAIWNLLWEALHLPLYTIWANGTLSEQIFAVIHCTGGDLLIAVSSLLLALCLIGERAWPNIQFWPVALLTAGFGVTYTVFSEWLNLVVRQSWAYSELMPVLPWLGTGLSPLIQWIVIPIGALWLARRNASAISMRTEIVK